MLSPKPPPLAVASLERRLEDLPMLPAVVVDVLALDPESDDYFDRTLELVERDPPFAARVLRIANSPPSAPTRPIMSVRQAVTRVGAKQCAELVLALAVMRVFVPRSEARRALWIHALQTALCARKACLHNPAFKNRADQAYLCGLLHDIGRFVQFDGAPDDLTRIDDSQWPSPRELVDVEQACLGYDHALLGWHACQKWRPPPLVAGIIRTHQAPAARSLPS